MKSHTAPIHACRTALKPLFPNKISPSAPPRLARSAGSLSALRTFLLFIRLICLRIGQPVSCACDPHRSPCCGTFQLNLATCCGPSTGITQGAACPHAGRSLQPESLVQNYQVFPLGADLPGGGDGNRGGNKRCLAFVFSQTNAWEMVAQLFLPFSLTAPCPGCSGKEGSSSSAPRLWVQPCVACAVLLEMFCTDCSPSDPLACRS